MKKHEDLNEQVKRLSLLLDLSKKFNSAITFKNLFKLVVREASRIVNAERSSIFVVDRDKNTLWTTIAQGTRRIELEMGEGIAGWVAQNGEMCVLDNPYKDKRFNKKVDSERNFKTRNLVAFPLHNRKGTIIGIFEVLNKKGGTFTDDDVELLTGIAGQIAISLETVLAYEEIMKSFESFIEVMAATIDARRPPMAGHSKRVSQYGTILAKEMGLTTDQIESVRLAGLLHDYGKIGIPDSILQKRSKLTDEEYDKIKEHVQITRDILKKIRYSDELKKVYEIAGYHHERFDGKGYPNGIKGENTPVEAKILALVDVFDAAVSEREYKKAKACDIVLQEILKGSGTEFDPDVVEGFKNCYDKIIKVKEKNEGKRKKTKRDLR